MRNTKILALPMVVMLGLFSTGVAYACWSDTLYINGSVATGTLCAEFVPPVITTDYGNDWTCDYGLINVRQLTQDVGSSSAYIVGTTCPDTIQITLDNVYPSYYEYITFWAHNCGTIPWRIQNVVFKTLSGDITIEDSQYLQLDLDDDGYNDVEIYWGNNFGDLVNVGDKVSISFEIHVLQEAPQGVSLSFTAEINVVQWDQYVQP